MSNETKSVTGPRVVYCAEMVGPEQNFSPSAQKPAAVMERWTRAWPTMDVRPAMPVTQDDLCRAHEPRFVRDILSGKEMNGFGGYDTDLAKSLLYTSGAMLTAARWALIDGGFVAAPVSGFHHARHDAAAGFCTFNGLMVTAMALREDCPSIRVGILDYDYHFGDGTEAIINKLGVRFITHITAGRRWKQGSRGVDFLTNILQDVRVLAEAKCDIVLYQAGGDQHIDDPLGGLLTTKQMALRDYYVFRGLASHGIPCAWNLAGGYQSPLSKVVDIHHNTMIECMNVQESVAAECVSVEA